MCIHFLKYIVWLALESLFSEWNDTFNATVFSESWPGKRNRTIKRRKPKIEKELLSNGDVAAWTFWCEGIVKFTKPAYELIHIVGISQAANWFVNMLKNKL